jgi:hypothetical protein
MAQRDRFQAMATRDAAQATVLDHSSSLTYRRVDTKTDSAIDGVLTEDSFAVPGIIGEGIGTEERSGTVFLTVAAVNVILAGRTPLEPRIGDKIIQTIGTLSTEWVVKTQARFDGAGGMMLNLRFDKTTNFSGPGVRKQ